jgi:serine phosphatase RsbU (regulator of sigma subunit)
LQLTAIRKAASQLVEGLYREAVRFSCNEPQKDDIAAVVIKVEAIAFR